MRNLFQKTGLLLIIAGAIICISSCRNKQEQIQPAPAFKVITLDTTSAVVYNDYSTIIQSNTIVEIRPKVSGYIKTIAKQEGTPVKKGDLIIKIDDADYQQDVNAAFASMEAAAANKSNAELEVVKLTPLVEKGIISQFHSVQHKSEKAIKYVIPQPIRVCAANISQSKYGRFQKRLAIANTSNTTFLKKVMAFDNTTDSPKQPQSLTAPVTHT